MGGNERYVISGAREAQSVRLRRRRRWYVALMGICFVLLVVAWTVIRPWSTSVAAALFGIAAVIPPVAAVVANWGEDH